MVYYDKGFLTEVRELVLEGKNNKEIAALTGKAVPTIKKYVGIIFKEEGVTTRNELFAKAISEMKQKC